MPLRVAGGSQDLVEQLRYLLEILEAVEKVDLSSSRKATIKRLVDQYLEALLPQERGGPGER